MSPDRILQRMRLNADVTEVFAIEVIEEGSRNPLPSMHTISLVICAAVLMIAAFTV